MIDIREWSKLGHSTLLIRSQYRIPGNYCALTILHEYYAMSTFQRVQRSHIPRRDSLYFHILLNIIVDCRISCNPCRGAGTRKIVQELGVKYDTADN